MGQECMRREDRNIQGILQLSKRIEDGHQELRKPVKEYLERWEKREPNSWEEEEERSARCMELPLETGIEHFREKRNSGPRRLGNTAQHEGRPRKSLSERSGAAAGRRWKRWRTWTKNTRLGLQQIDR
ncbi:predicted protein [Histoplasma capsulatum var. duboisii H88]|uniref:Predicted protein n=2 Tax=Ajellomyces capsulatus TaxID=5037 RepID=F0U625_AJEC8|nr:predicted protein [Histoplasma capsulatum H143]EGC41416.1 predicted protein [Histoplasma capsulatum var. duboisii H88]